MEHLHPNEQQNLETTPTDQNQQWTYCDDLQPQPNRLNVISHMLVTHKLHCPFKN